MNIALLPYGESYEITIVCLSIRRSVCPSVSLSVCLSVPQFGVFLGNVSLVFLGMAPQITQNKKFAYLYNISPKACCFFLPADKRQSFLQAWSIFLGVCVCTCVCVCVCLRPFIVKALPVWISWNTREQINDVILETLISYAKFLHSYFRMQHLIFLTSHLIMLIHQDRAKPQLK